MSTYTGFDMAPSALRWFVRDGTGAVGQSDGPVYGIRGCPMHPDRGYDSAVSWADAMAFREGEFTEKFKSGVEKTVRYELPEGHASEWLRSFFRSTEGRPSVDVNGTIAVAVPDHASPEERDEVLAGLSATKYANVSLIWRPVAALLGWMDQQKNENGVDLATLLDRRIFVLDLDAGHPELTELKCVRHRMHQEWIVPSRKLPSRDTLSADGAFERDCYRAALDGVQEWEQLVGGQFYADLQRAIESGDAGFDAWVRNSGAWSPRRVEFADALPKDILRALNPIVDRMWRTMHDRSQSDKVTLLVNGWVARRYEEQMLAPFKAQCGYVFALSADSVARGAALFAERLAKGQPTFYDRITDYFFWDGFKLKWERMFNGEQEVEPGREYRYPEPGGVQRKLKIEKYADNVSFYVRTPNSNTPNSNEYARRIKTVFAEFLRTDLELSLSAVVAPEKGSARFELAMCDTRSKPIFVSGKTTAREIILRWSNSLKANKSVTVESVPEHQGYVEPQPVLGRIYDSEDNLRMVEEYVRDPGGAGYARLWRAYSSRFHPDPSHGIADRVGYDATPREPTRGLFGTRYVFNTQVDKATHDFAVKCAQKKPYVEPALFIGAGDLNRDGMLLQNYCHSGALDDYKKLIRDRLKAREEPQNNFSFYYAAGYVLGDDPQDIVILLNYICSATRLGVERERLWWSFFRMLCWHPECKLIPATAPLLEKALSILCTQDAEKVVNGGNNERNGPKYLLLAILYALRIRESGGDLSSQLKKQLIDLLSPEGLLGDVKFPKTMVPRVDPTSRPRGDTLSKYVLRFVMQQDTLADRELGAAMGGV